MRNKKLELCKCMSEVKSFLSAVGRFAPEYSGTLHFITIFIHYGPRKEILNTSARLIHLTILVDFRG
jgi:hypothetical protein